MTWWNRESLVPKLPSDCAGDVIPAPPKEPTVAPEDPEPDLSTKPKDFWEFRLGLACRKKHPIAVDETGQLGAPGLAKINPIICSHCGSMIIYAVFKILKTHEWRDVLRSYYNSKPAWGWEPWPKDWGDWKFVHYLDTPRRKKK
jgi:hypothetical protein